MITNTPRARSHQWDGTLLLPRTGSVFTPSTLMRAESFEHVFAGDDCAAIFQRLPHLVRATRLVATVEKESRPWYRAQFDREFDPCALGDTAGEALSFFRHHPSFTRALEALKIDQSEGPPIQLPWWNELALIEIGCERTPTGTLSTLRVAHSYAVQRLRAGCNPHGVATVSLSGVLTTAPTRRGDPGSIVLGLRGGERFPNTWHIFAGTAQYSEALRRPGYSLLQLFKDTELREEVGLPPGSYSIKPLCRFVDSGLVPFPGDVNYCFHVQTSLTFEQVQNCWLSGRPVDRSEHSDLIAIPNTREAVEEFIQRNYRGPTSNDGARPLKEPVLLHPAAIALAGYIGMDLSVLERIARGAHR